ncbi:hypothetical protein SO694_00048155 [Aureococcus anophagefferens]|uniref:LamG-like jellyroll fold domain-containing protein n=1 Tax=Aureococcus anophagefferens TaxID=44056 RepID=A0ABR1G7V6_AURAN
MGRRSFLVALGVASTRGDQITRSMIAAYTFDDQTAADTGPNEWHGTAANYVPVFTERGDYAMSFGGNWDDDGGVIDDDIVFPAAVTAALGGSADRSFCLFADIDQFDDGVMFYYGAAETDREFGLRTENAGAPAYVSVQFYDHDVAVDAPTVADGAWHHYCLTYAGSSGIWKLFVDGNLLESATKVLDTGTSTALRMGNRDTGTHEFHGALDEFYVFNESLTSSSVAQLYTALTLGLTPSPTASFSPTARPSADICSPVAFSAPVVETAAAGPRDVVALDVDGDGDVDLLTAEYASSSVVWYEANNAGSGFRASVVSDSVDGAQSVFAIDVDGDADVDALSASYNDNDVTWYEQRPDGSGIDWYAHQIFGAGGYVYDVSAIDVDGDGDVDALHADVTGDASLALWVNDGAESFVQFDISTSASSPRSVCGFDFNGDGDVDVVSGEAGVVALYGRNGAGYAGVSLTSAVSSVYRAVPADIDGDGLTDLVVASSGDNSVKYFRGATTASVGAAQVVDRDMDMAVDVDVADFDGDGTLDVVAAAFVGGLVRVYETDTATVLADQDWGSGTTLRSGAGEVGAATPVDLDGDADVDVLAALYDNSVVESYANECESAPAPSLHPTWPPTRLPTRHPTHHPTHQPTHQPTTPKPSPEPTPSPTPEPSADAPNPTLWILCNANADCGAGEFCNNDAEGAFAGGCEGCYYPGDFPLGSAVCDRYVASCCGDGACDSCDPSASATPTALPTPAPMPKPSISSSPSSSLSPTRAPSRETLGAFCNCTAYVSGAAPQDGALCVSAFGSTCRAPNTVGACPGNFELCLAATAARRRAAADGAPDVRADGRAVAPAEPRADDARAHARADAGADARAHARAPFAAGSPTAAGAAAADAEALVAGQSLSASTRDETLRVEAAVLEATAASGALSAETATSVLEGLSAVVVAAAGDGDGGAAAAVYALEDELLDQTAATLAPGETSTELEASAVVARVALVDVDDLDTAGKPTLLLFARENASAAVPFEALGGPGHVKQVRATVWRASPRAATGNLAGPELEVEVVDDGTGSVVAVADLEHPVKLELPGAGTCVFWDGDAWSTRGLTPVEKGCASTHLSSFAVAALAHGESSCAALRRKPGAALYASAAYRAFVVAAATAWGTVFAWGFRRVVGPVLEYRRDHRHMGWRSAAKSIDTVNGRVAVAFVCLGLMRGAYYGAVAVGPRENTVCRELDSSLITLHDAGTPVYLGALSAVCLYWWQLPQTKGSKPSRAVNLKGRALSAFVVFNVGFLVLNSAALAGLVFGAPVRRLSAGATARTALMVYAAAASVEGVAYVVFGLRLVTRLDALAAKNKCDKVLQLQRRVRVLLVVCGVGTMVCGALAALFASLKSPTPRDAFLCFAVGVHAVELVVGIVSAVLVLRSNLGMEGAKKSLFDAARKARESVRMSLMELKSSLNLGRRTTSPSGPPKPDPDGIELEDHYAHVDPMQRKSVRESPMHQLAHLDVDEQRKEIGIVLKLAERNSKIREDGSSPRARSLPKELLDFVAALEPPLTEAQADRVREAIRILRGEYESLRRKSSKEGSRRSSVGNDRERVLAQKHKIRMSAAGDVV